MTVSSTTQKTTVNGDGATTAFPTGFFFIANGDVTIIHVDSTGTETAWVETTDYTLTGAGEASGGTVTAIVAPASGEKLIIKRIEQLTQPDDLPTSGPLPSATVEQMGDRAAMMAQQLQEQIDRTPTLKESTTTGSLSFPEPSADKAIVWNSAGTARENSTNDPDVSADAAAASATAAATSATNAASSASSASTSATNAATSATAAANAASGVGAQFTFDTSTAMADPGAGDFRFDNATVASVTAIAFDATSADTGNPDLSDFIAAADDSTSTVAGHIILKKSGTPATFAVFSITSVADNSGWLEATVVHVASNGTWSASDIAYAQFIRTGDKGDTGATGATGATGPTGNAAGVLMAWESATADTDQGAGKVWLDNATPASAVVLYMDDLEDGGASINALVDTWDDSTSTALRGTITVTKNSAPENFHIFNITGAITSASTYSKVPVAHAASSGTISDTDAVSVQMVRTGNAGAGDMTSTNNLSDVADAATSATNLGLGTGDDVVVTSVTGQIADTAVAKNATSGLVSENTADTSIDIISGTTDDGYLYFMDGGGTPGRIRYEHGIEDMTFFANHQEVLKLNGIGSAANWIEATSAIATADPTIAPGGDDATVGLIVDTKGAGETLDLRTDGTSRADITDAGVRLGAANARVTTVLDEDAMGSDSATALATQQSIKKYVDDNAGGVDVQVITSTANWTKPASGTWVQVHLWAGGGSGGGGSSAGNHGAGGGGGSYATMTISIDDLAATESASIGAGGAAATNAVGNVGGNSTFGTTATFITAYGGGGGEAVDNGGGGGGGGYSAVGSVGSGTTGGNGGGPDGGAGGTSTVDGSASTGFGGGGGGGGGSASGGAGFHYGGGGGAGGSDPDPGGAAVFGGGGGGGSDDTTGGLGGVSAAGGNGGQGSSGDESGDAGTQPGGGGGGAFKNTNASGKGGDGLCVVITY